MAFVNERITSANWKQYGIPEFEQRIVCSHFAGPATYTVDNERNISLIHLAAQLGDEHQPTGLHGWRFNWHGHELWVEMKLLVWGGKAGEPGWSHWELRRIGSMKQEGVIVLGDARYLPLDLQPHRDEILKDLRDAFEAHHGLNGVYSRYSSYKMTLELAKGV